MLLVAVEEGRARAECAVQSDQPTVQNPVRYDLSRQQRIDKVLVPGAARLGRQGVGELVDLRERVSRQHRNHPVSGVAKTRHHRFPESVASMKRDPGVQVLIEVEDTLLHPARFAKPLAQLRQSQRPFVIDPGGVSPLPGLDPVVPMLEGVGRQGHTPAPLAPQPLNVKVHAQCPQPAHDRTEVNMVGRHVIRVAHRRHHALRRRTWVLAHEGTQHVARADFEKDMVVGLEQCVHAIGEQDGIAEVLHPILRVAGARRRQPLAGAIGDDAQLGLAELDALQIGAEARQDLVEQARVTGDVDAHALGLDALGGQARHQCIQVVDTP